MASDIDLVKYIKKIDSTFENLEKRILLLINDDNAKQIISNSTDEIKKILNLLDSIQITNQEQFEKLANSFSNPRQIFGLQLNKNLLNMNIINFNAINYLYTSVPLILEFFDKIIDLFSYFSKSMKGINSLNEIQKEYDSLELEVNQLVYDKTALNQEIEFFMSENKRLSTLLDVKTANLEDYVSEFESLRRKYLLLSSKTFKTKNVENNGNYNAKIKEITDENLKLKDDLIKLERAKKNLNSTISEHEDQIMLYEQKIEDLKKELLDEKRKRENLLVELSKNTKN